MRKIIFVPLLVCACAQMNAQTSTVQQLGALPVTQLTSGLGWNVDTTNQWEFQQAAAAGAKSVRFQCAWGDAYGGRAGGSALQSLPPNNYSEGFETPACAQGIAYAKQYGLEPVITAAYGPPYEQILSLNVTSGASVGATSVQVSFASGQGGETLSSIQFPYDYLYGSANYAEISSKHSYPGTLITGVNLNGSNNATINLASALQVSLPAGTSLQVNRVLYPSTASDSANDPSIQDYVAYVRSLGQQCASNGVSCQIEIWNEPPWPDDCWDNRSDCYDQNPGYNEQQYGPNWGFVAALQATASIPGVTYIWGGTDKSGDSSVLSPSMQQYSGTTFSQANNPVTAEGFHPYGNNPEDNMWNLPCTQTLLNTNNWTGCNLIGGSSSNEAEIIVRTSTLQQTNPSFNLNLDITETGASLALGDQAHQARYLIRQFLGYMAAGVKSIDFMDLYDCNQGFGVFSDVNGSNGSCNPTPASAPPPQPAYTALAGLESDLATIGNAPATSYSTSSLTSVASYDGTYPLEVFHVVGAKSGASQNSEMVDVWQLSTCFTTSCWFTLGSPVGAPLTLNIPSGMAISSVTNLDTRASVSYTTSGQQVSFSISDDPVEVLVQPSTTATPPPTPPTPPTPPSNPTQPTLALASAVSGSGSSETVTFTAMLSPYASGSNTTNGENIFFFDGQTTLGHAPLSNGVATLTVNASSLPSGTSQVLATFGGSSVFGAAVGTTTVNVSLQSPTPTAPTLTLTASVGGAVTLTATLSPYTSGSTTTNGANIFFFDGQTTLGYAPLTNGVATLTVNGSSLPGGTSQVLATFGGSSVFGAATGTVAVTP